MQIKSVFNIRELVLLGVMNAMFIVLFYAVIMAVHFIPPLWGMIDPMANFLLAPVYVLMLRLIPKPFVMTIHGVILGLFHTMTGWWPGLVAGLVGGLLADGIAMLVGGYTRRRAVILSVVVFATAKTFLFYFPVYMVVLFPVFQGVVSTWPKEAVEGYSAAFAGVVLVANLAACLIGLYLGQKMITRHFSKVGMVEL